MPRQFVQLKLSPNSDKLYTYVNDQPAEVKKGDTVEIELPNGGRRLIEVEDVTDVRPTAVPEWINLKPCYKAG